MYRRNLFKKAMFTVLTIALVKSLTACSVSLKPISDVPDTKNVINVVQEVVDSVSDEQFKDTYETINVSKDLKESLYTCGYELEKATLIRVIDGDTIVVEMEDEETTIRLIGINTPESVASQEYLDRTGKENTAEGKNASDWVKNFLANYPEVYLQKDVSETDRYGRTLRYVWIEVPKDCDDIEEIRTKMLNGILLDNGLAEVTIYKPDTKYADEFQAIYTDTTDNFVNDFEER